jgi:lysyl endopeptidase
MKNRSALVLLAAACPLAIAAWAVGADKPSVDRTISVMPEVATEGLTPLEQRDHQENLSSWLAAERPAGAAATIRVQISDDEMRSIEEPEVTNAAPLKVGVVIPMATPLNLNGLVSAKTGLPTRDTLAGGQLTQTRDGGYVWAVTVGSENAGGIRLHIDNLFLPNNAELYFYSDSGEAYGPYTSMGPEDSGEFWTPSVFGRDGTLQIRFNGPVTKNDLLNTSLTVTEVGHISRAFFGFIDSGVVDEGSVASFCSTNASCIVNNSCTSNAAVNNAELAVAKMLWVQGCCIYTCSGGLIADTDTATQIPLFITAGHCLSQSNSGLEAFFQYQASCGSTANCTATWTDPPVGSYAGKTVGATVLAQASISSGDYCLLQLSQAPPAGSVFLGWNTTAVSGSNGTALYRVSHPSGAPQAYSDQTVNTSAGTCQGWPRGPLIYSRGVTGATEGGSSGSPVVNSSGQIVGTLTGSCGTNLNNVCDHNANATVDGAFAYYYTAISSFLTGGGGGTCGALGATCSSNASCCSNKCRGGKCR